MRRHLSYANVMATIAVFIALGGASYAAMRVTGKDVVNRSLTGKDIKKKSVKLNRLKGDASARTCRARRTSRTRRRQGRLPVPPMAMTKADADAKFLPAAGISDVHGRPAGTGSSTRSRTRSPGSSSCLGSTWS